MMKMRFNPHDDVALNMLREQRDEAIYNYLEDAYKEFRNQSDLDPNESVNAEQFARWIQDVEGALPFDIAFDWCESYELDLETSAISRQEDALDA